MKRLLLVPHTNVISLMNSFGRFYSGKMYGADAVFGWIDSSGEGHVEAWGLPTYESADILDAPKADGYVACWSEHFMKL